MEKKSKVLILGSNGMLGHVLNQFLKESNYDVFTTNRHSSKKNNYFLDVYACHEELEIIIKKIHPNYIINCIGLLVEQSLKDPKKAIKINSFFPHYVASLSDKYGFKFIHVSTDCVFNGNDGPYEEDSMKNEINYYGLSKNLGEVINYKNSLTIRTSIIGPEIRTTKTGLFNWFLNTENKLYGYTNVIWSGLTTLELSKFIKHVLNKNSIFNLNLIHATNNIPISKFNLLNEINNVFEVQKEIKISSKKNSNKQLINNKDLDFKFNSYKKMILEMKDWINENQDLYALKL